MVVEMMSRKEHLTQEGLQKIVNIKAIPIIVLTAKEGMAEIFKVEGVKDYITKPFKPEVLLTAVKKYLE